MDRVELGIKLEQIVKLQKKGDYMAAARVADTIEWRKVKKWSELLLAATVYEKAGRPRDARNVYVYGYNRNLGGRQLVYKLTELSIIIGDMDEAEDLYKEFVEMAPHDMSRYILMYQLKRAKGAPDEELIKILEEYKDNELDERYGYELAALYAKTGQIDACVKECDDLILWFNDGSYVEKALLLKRQYADLTKSQLAKYGLLKEKHAPGGEAAVPSDGQNGAEAAGADTDISASASEDQETQAESVKGFVTSNDTTEIKVPDEESFAAQERPEAEADSLSEIQVQEKDYSIYDTQNIQAELAKSMEIIMAGIRREEEAKRTAREAAKDAAVSEAVTVPSAEAADDMLDREQPVKETDMQDVEPVEEDDAAGLELAESEEPEMEESSVTEPETKEAEAMSATESEQEEAEDAFAAEAEPEAEELPVTEPETEKAEENAAAEQETEQRTEAVPSAVEKEEKGNDEAAGEEAEPSDGFEEVMEETVVMTDPNHVRVVEIMEDDDEVDEPTREIIINTHRWKRIYSEMDPEPLKPEKKEEPTAEPEAEKAGEKSVTEPESEAVKAEPVAEPETKEAQEAPVTESETEETTEEHAAIPEAEEAKETSATEPEPEEVKEEPEVTAAAAKENIDDAKTAAAEEFVSHPVQLELHLEDPVVEGQISLLDYLEHMDEEPETTEAEETPAIEPEPEEAQEMSAVEPETEEPEEMLPTEPETKEEKESPETEQEAKEEPSAVEKEETITAEETEENGVKEPEPEDAAETSDAQDAAAEKEAEEKDPVEAAMDELTKQLMDEVAADLKERETEVHPGLEEISAVEESLIEAALRESTATREMTAQDAADPVETEPEEDDENALLTNQQRRYISKYLYIQGMEASISELLAAKRKEKPDGTSMRGNIAVFGKSDTDKVNFAIDLFKTMCVDLPRTGMKIAKTTAEILNRRGIEATKDKIIGTALMIEHAGHMEQKTISGLNTLMEQQTDNMLVILLGEDFSLRRLFIEYPRFAEKFEYELELKRYTVNELIAIAKEYARGKGYCIDEKALVELYLMFGAIEANEPGSEVTEVERIIDLAISKNTKKRHGNALIPLKEKHFREKKGVKDA